ncbi:MAG: ABC transporter permease [Porticoccaceae bacterium]|jgi:ribose transport system permease protein|nr:ABC transporter permease [Pseudomonadota bacterium]MBT5071910.1 ABC transporter permease [Porticoccaceae bacterium]MBT6264326.1 ABC transporter permease [Halieaceae bacterium]MDA9776589.1 ABC transporter permease [Paracoccaceae bacterium]MDA9944800.1 ABC transporter permease [Paracoccaceae bacterium]
MLQKLRQSGTLLGFFLILLFFALKLPDTFLTARNLINISQQLSMLAVVAATMTIVMVMNDFDLSVGSMASLSGIVAAMLFTAGYPVWVGLSVALLVGVFGGLFNGFLVSVVGILPFVATLGTLTVFSGLAFLLSDGKTIFGRDIPSSFSGFARAGIEIGDVKVPMLTITAGLVIFICWAILEHTNFGRRLYAIGGNKEASYLAGIKVVRLRLIAFSLTGLGAAGAGLMYAARVASANPTQGSGLMLDAIAAVFLGMTMSRRGEPKVVYTLVGVLILGVLDNGMTQLRVDSYVREIFVGLIVLAAVAVASLSKRRNAK